MISLTLVGLAALILVVELARNHTAPEAGAVLSLLAAVALAARRLLRDLRAHPAIAPAPTRVRPEPRTELRPNGHHH